MMHDFPFKILHHDCLHSSWSGGETLDPAMAALLDVWCRFSYAGWKIRAVQRHKTSQDTKLQPKKCKEHRFFFGGGWWSGHRVLKRSPPFLFLGERSKTFSELTDFVDCWNSIRIFGWNFLKGKKRQHTRRCSWTSTFPNQDGQGSECLHELLQNGPHTYSNKTLKSDKKCKMKEQLNQK